MIHFFRNIRKTLLSENKTTRYFKYAIGEVILIMLGIFMALQLQNWNEKRKQEAEFKVTLEQLYTTIKYDAEAFYRHSEGFDYYISVIDSILKYPATIKEKDLPYILYEISYNGTAHNSESIYHSKELKYNPENQDQKNITKEILQYINAIGSYKYQVEDRLIPALQSINIPHPKVNFDNGKSGWDDLDSTYYSKEDLKNLSELINSNSFRAILKTVRSFKVYNYYDSKNLNSDALSIRELIKDYYPDVKVTYKDVGIIGTSIDGYDDVGAKSTPMTLTDPENNIWSVTLYLKEGTVKFRCRDSWAQNWGYTHGAETIFPKGRALQDGGDIPITEAGNYKVILNLSQNTYEFIKQND